MRLFVSFVGEIFKAAAKKIKGELDFAKKNKHMVVVVSIVCMGFAIAGVGVGFANPAIFALGLFVALSAGPAGLAVYKMSEAHKKNQERAEETHQEEVEKEIEIEKKNEKGKVVERKQEVETVEKKEGEELLVAQVVSLPNAVEVVPTYNDDEGPEEDYISVPGEGGNRGQQGGGNQGGPDQVEEGIPTTQTTNRSWLGKMCQFISKHFGF